MNARLRPLYPGKENRYPLYVRQGRPRCRSVSVPQMSPSPSIRHQLSHHGSVTTVKTACRYGGPLSRTANKQWRSGFGVHDRGTGTGTGTGTWTHDECHLDRPLGTNPGSGKGRLQSSTNIGRVIKSKSNGWARHVARMGRRGI